MISCLVNGGNMFCDVCGQIDEDCECDIFFDNENEEDRISEDEREYGYDGEY